MSLKLTGKQIRYLKTLAHSLKPTLNVGKGGLSESFFQETDQCLLTHELIKIKLLESCPIGKEECSKEMQKKLDSNVVQIIGRTIVLYRPHPEEPTIIL